MNYAPIWDTVLPSEADPHRSYGSRDRSPDQLNFSFDESLIELHQMISNTDQREIHLGWQQVLDRPVEIHRLQESNEQRRKRFWAESHALAQIEHPGVMPIHDRGDDFMSLRKSPPKSFVELIGDQGASGESLIYALECLSKVIDTLRHSHQQGIIHGDIQPSYIAIGDHGEVMLQNWQLSAPIDVELLPAGTPSWLPPEASQGAYFGETADVFQIAALVHYVFTGRTPWIGDTAQDCLSSMMEGVALAFDKEVRASNLGQGVARCLDLNPQNRLPLHELHRVLQAWLALAGQKAEAHRLLTLAQRRFSDAYSLRSDKELRNAQREVMTARALDDDIDDDFLIRICQKRFDLAIEREDLVLAQSLMIEYLQGLPGGYEERLALAFERREKRKRLSALFRKVVIGAGVLACVIPLVLMAITYLSDVYQDAQSRKLADQLISEAHSAESWSQAQALLSRASGLAPSAPTLTDVQSYWAAKGVSEVLSQGDIVAAEQRLVLVTQALNVGHAPQTQILIDQLSTDIHRERERQELAREKDWEIRQQIMLQRLAESPDQLNLNQVREIAEQWSSWDWQEEYHFRQFVGFLNELIARGGNASRVASLTLIQLFDRQKGNDVSLAGFEQIDLLPLIGMLYDNDDQIRLSIANELVQRLDGTDLDYYLPFLLNAEHQHLIRIREDIAQATRFKSVFDRIYAVFRSSNGMNHLNNRIFMVQLYQRGGFKNEAYQISTVDRGERYKQIGKLRDVLWNRRHDEVDRLAAALLDEDESSHVRSLWVISYLHRRDFKKALHIIEDFRGGEPSITLQALTVPALYWNNRFEEAHDLALELIKDANVSGTLSGHALGYFTEVLENLNLDEEKELFIRQVAATEARNWWKQLELVEGLREAGKLEDALEKSQQVLSRWPQFHFGYAEQSRVYLALNRLEEAYKSAEMALSIMPRNPGIMASHAYVMLHDGRREHALSRYTMGTRMKSTFRHGYVNMMLYARSSEWQGTAFDGIRSWFNEVKPYASLARVYGRFNLEHNLTSDYAQILADEGYESEELRDLWNGLMLHVGDLATTGWPSIGAEELARACLNEALVHATDERGTRASVAQWLTRAQQHDAELVDHSLFVILKAWVDQDVEVWRSLTAQHTAVIERSSVTKGWGSIGESPEQVAILIHNWSIFDEPPIQALPWPQVLPHRYMSMWQRNWRVPEITFTEATRTALLRVWQEHAVEWYQHDDPSVSMEIFGPIGDDGPSEVQQNILKKWFNGFEWPLGPVPKRKQVLKQLPRVDASWDFPPQVYRERQERLKNMKKK